MSVGMKFLLLFYLITIIDASHFVLVLRFEDPPIAQLRFSSERQHELSLRGETTDLHAVWHGQIETAGGSFSSLELSPRWHRKVKILANVTDTKGDYLRLSYHLQCEAGFFGSMCSIECIPNDRSTCSSSGTRLCLPGWRGANCSTVDDSCALSPCLHGECRLTGGDGFLCECKLGFEGMLCDQKVSQYLPNPKTTSTTVTIVTKTTSTTTTSTAKRKSRISTSTSSTTTTTTLKTSVTTVVTTGQEEYSNQILDIVIVVVVAAFIIIAFSIVALIVCLRRRSSPVPQSISRKCCLTKVSLNPSPERYSKPPTSSLQRCISPSLPSTAGCTSPPPPSLMPFSKAPSRYVSQESVDV